MQKEEKESGCRIRMWNLDPLDRLRIWFIIGLETEVRRARPRTLKVVLEQFLVGGKDDSPTTKVIEKCAPPSLHCLLALNTVLDFLRKNWIT